jgi:hypothetical protein
MDAIVRVFNNLNVVQKFVCRPDHAKLDNKGSLASESMSIFSSSIA